MSTRTSRGRFWLGMGLGALCGATLARLYTPCSGSEARRLLLELRDRTEDRIIFVVDRTSDQVARIQVQSQNRLGKLRTQVLRSS